VGKMRRSVAISCENLINSTKLKEVVAKNRFLKSTNDIVSDIIVR